MNKRSHHHTTQVDDRVPLPSKLAYGVGGAVDNFMQQSVRMMANPILNIALHVNPILVSTAIALPRLWDAFTDPIMGHVSDNARFRSGRRRIFIAIGGILCGLVFFTIWLMPRGWSEFSYFLYFLVTSLLFYTCYTIFSVPYTALGFEISPDYHERTRMMGIRTFFGAIGGFAIAWLYYFTQLDIFSDTVEGMRFVGLVAAIVIAALAVVPALVIREKAPKARNDSEKVPLGKSFKETMQNKPFRMLLFVVLIMVIGMNLINQLGLYVMIYHVFGGETGPAAALQGVGGTVFNITVLITVPLFTHLSTKVGKVRTLAGCLVLGLMGSVSKWWCYSPQHPYLVLIPYILLSPALSALWILSASMVADICDVDELETGERREGMFGAVYWWLFKAGLTVAQWISGIILVASGFNIALGAHQTAHCIWLMRFLFAFVPAFVFGVAFFVILRFPITEEMAYSTKRLLEERRGTMQEIR